MWFNTTLGGQECYILKIDLELPGPNLDTMSLVGHSRLIIIDDEVTVDD